MLVCNFEDKGHMYPGSFNLAMFLKNPHLCLFCVDLDN